MPQKTSFDWSCYLLLFKEALMPLIYPITMKKISLLIASSALALLSATAFACPPGTQLQGGTGPHHKGGTCVGVTKAKTKAAKTTPQKVTHTVKNTTPEKSKLTPSTTTTASSTTHHEHL